jgi:hypothetical protein
MDIISQIIEGLEKVRRIVEFSQIKTIGISPAAFKKLVCEYYLDLIKTVLIKPNVPEAPEASVPAPDPPKPVPDKTQGLKSLLKKRRSK